MHNLVRIPMRRLEIKNKENGNGTFLQLEFTDADLKKLQDRFNLIGVEIKLLETENVNAQT